MWLGKLVFQTRVFRCQALAEPVFGNTDAEKRRPVRGPKDDDLAAVVMHSVLFGVVASLHTVRLGVCEHVHSNTPAAVG